MTGVSPEIMRDFGGLCPEIMRDFALEVRGRGRPDNLPIAIGNR